ncbi:MAG: beta-galactosidase [Victivallales bacterium]|nr:beta-galactosidase [Victivallales bacterium]
MLHKFWSRIILVFGLLSVFAIIAEEMPCTAIVQDGTLLAGNVYYASDWHQEPGQLVGAGTNRFVISRHAFDSSEFLVHARLTLERRAQTAATFCMGKYALGLDGSEEYPYFFEVQGVQPVRRIAAAVRFSPGEEFLFEAAGKGGRVVFSVNGEVIADCAIDTTEPLCFGFRPQRNTIRIKEFFVYGKSLGENTMQIEQLNNIVSTVPTVQELLPVDIDARFKLKGSPIPVDGEFLARLSPWGLTATAGEFPVTVEDGFVCLPAELLRRCFEQCPEDHDVRVAELQLFHGASELLRNRLALYDPKSLHGFATGRVASQHGQPCFALDGKPLPTITARAGRTYWMRFVGRAVRQFAEAGIHVNIAILFPYQFMEHGGNYEVDWPAMLADFEHFAVRTLAEDPDARFMLYYDLRVPDTFVEEYPEEAIQLDNGKTTLNYGVNGKLQPSYASPRWRGLMAARLDEFLSRLARHPLAYSVAGIKLLYANCGEWNHWGYHEEAFVDFSEPMQYAFGEWLRREYRTVEALRAAWGNDAVDFDSANLVPPREVRLNGGWLRIGEPALRQAVDYARFFQEHAAETILHFARTAKRATDGKLLVGSYYGYYWGHYGNNPYHFQDSGNYGLKYLLDSPDIDFIGGPSAYLWRRHHALVNGISGSLALHGKLWETEGDMRTHLAPPEDADYGRTDDLEESIAMLKRNFCTEFAARSNFYFFDFVNDWYRDQEFMDTVGQLVKMDDFLRQLPERRPAEIACIVSEETIPYLGNNRRWDALDGLARQAMELPCVGAPMDFYVESDLANIDFNQYRTVVFLNSFHVSDETLNLVHSRVACDNRTLVFYYAAGAVGEDLRLAPERMRKLTGMALDFQPAKPTGVVARMPSGTPCIVEYPPDGRVTVVDPQATPLAAHEDGTVAAARRQFDDWTSIVIGHTAPNPAFLRSILQEDGKVHLYQRDSYDWIFQRGALLGVFSRESGLREITFPESVEVVGELFSRQVLAQDSDKVRFEMPARPHTAMLFAGSREEWEMFLKMISTHK